MDPAEITRLCIDSCDQLMNAVRQERRSGNLIGLDEIKADYEIKRGYVTFTARSPVYDTTGLKLCIGSRVYGDPDAVFSRFDPLSMTMVGYVSKEVYAQLKRGGEDVRLVNDLLWLVESTHDYFAVYGDRLALPSSTTGFGDEDIVFPDGMEPSPEQRDAVRTVLNSPLSYVWGAPGTGKTQFVLATAMMAELRKGRKVAVIAPTNNSVEQVLRGLLAIIEKEDPRGEIVDMKHDILRLGTASADFIRDYPDVCEMRGIRKKIADCESVIRVLREILFSKREPELVSALDTLESYYSGGPVSGRDARECVRRVREIVRMDPDSPDRGFDIGRDDYRERIAEVRSSVCGRHRPEAEYRHYEDWTPEMLREEEDRQEKELDRLSRLTPAARAATARILAMTPHKLMRQFGPEKNENNEKLEVDHIFMDEVAYCNVIHALPMFTFGVPITMLGDHMQLPPVCELEHGSIVVSALIGEGVKDCFVWEQSALFAQGLFTGSEQDAVVRFTGGDGPDMSATRLCTLTASHRFGENLAHILDDCVYRNGIRGSPGRALEIVCIDTVCGSRDDRSNPAEIAAVKDYLERNSGDIGSFAVLTPYSAQVRGIAAACPKHKNSILTVHKSQGREWDTVVFSASDCRAEVPGKDCQLRFTSTVNKDGGLYVVNTAVSRAKRRLVLVCDRDFWMGKEGELIGRMASEADSVEEFRYIE